MITIPRARGHEREAELEEFASELKSIQRTTGFKVSSRGWCYQLEELAGLTKADFDLVENIINECRKKGYLAIDFVAEEEGRKFSGVEHPDTESIPSYLRGYLSAMFSCERWYTPEWWDGEEHYIQMVVEKIDLKTLFEPVCRRYHIPIASSKGWASMNLRAEYARRFKEAEENGLKCVLLYCGDHDPDGLRISEFLRNNLADLSEIEWEDGTDGYDPEMLEIDRFGLNFDFIEEAGLSWINNLITGSKKNLADPDHKNFKLPYIQDYLRDIGERKCEANAIVTRPEKGKALAKAAIEHWLGKDALDRFQKKRDGIVKRFRQYRERIGLEEPIRKAMSIIDRDVDDNDQEDSDARTG